MSTVLSLAYLSWRLERACGSMIIKSSSRSRRSLNVTVSSVCKDLMLFTLSRTYLVNNVQTVVIWQMKKNNNYLSRADHYIPSIN